MNEVVVTKGEEIQVTAAQPAEMVEAQGALIAWCSKKIAGIRSEITELQEELDIATKNKWRTASFKRLLALAKARIIFYGKVHKSLKLGYCIVPNFPVTGFAIRTDKAKPAGQTTFDTWANFEQFNKGNLPEGEGQYQNPFPVIFQREVEVMQSDKLVKKKQFFPEAWRDLEFPLSMAKPTIMAATAAAMELNLFDSFGICPPQAGRVDPMVIGQIMDPRPTVIRRERKRVSFLIAWHLDSSVL